MRPGHEIIILKLKLAGTKWGTLNHVRLETFFKYKKITHNSGVGYEVVGLVRRGDRSYLEWAMSLWK